MTFDGCSIPSILDTGLREHRSRQLFVATHLRYICSVLCARSGVYFSSIREVNLSLQSRGDQRLERRRAKKVFSSSGNRTPASREFGDKRKS